MARRADNRPCQAESTSEPIHRKETIAPTESIFNRRLGKEQWHVMTDQPFDLVCVAERREMEREHLSLAAPSPVRGEQSQTENGCLSDLCSTPAGREQAHMKIWTDRALEVEDQPQATQPEEDDTFHEEPKRSARERKPRQMLVYDTIGQSSLQPHLTVNTVGTYNVPCSLFWGTPPHGSLTYLLYYGFTPYMQFTPLGY